MNPLQVYNVRVQRPSVPAEVHDTAEARKLKESCQQFESILWAQIWKGARDNAREFGGGEKAKPWKQMEDLSIEMASEEIAKSGGAGLWKVLYDQMIVNVAANMEKVHEEAVEAVNEEEANEIKMDEAEDLDAEFL
jgi:Rod binding domain-containing protein